MRRNSQLESAPSFTFELTKRQNLLIREQPGRINRMLNAAQRGEFSLAIEWAVALTRDFNETFYLANQQPPERSEIRNGLRELAKLIQLDKLSSELRQRFDDLLRF